MTPKKQKMIFLKKLKLDQSQMKARLLCYGLSDTQ